MKPQRQTLGDGGLANTWFTHQQGIVFPATAKDLDDAVQFCQAAYQRINLAFGGAGHQVHGVGLQWVRRRGFAFFTRCISGFSGLGNYRFRGSMREIAQQGQALKPLGSKVVGTETFGFLKHRDQNTTHIHDGLLRGQSMKDGPLHDPLKTQAGRGVQCHADRQDLYFLFEKGIQ